MHSGFSGWMIAVAVGVVLLYFVPSILARVNRKREFGKIFLVNLFFGWTVVGWLVAIFWASTRDATAMEYVGPAGKVPVTGSNGEGVRWGTRECPACRDRIPADAASCPRCRSDLRRAG